MECFWFTKWQSSLRPDLKFHRLQRETRTSYSNGWNVDNKKNKCKELKPYFHPPPTALANQVRCTIYSQVQYIYRQKKSRALYYIARKIWSYTDRLLDIKHHQCKLFFFILLISRKASARADEISDCVPSYLLLHRWDSGCPDHVR